MQSRKLLVVDALAHNLGRRAGHELDDGGGEAGLEEDLVDEVVGVRCHRGRLPDTDIADDGGCADKVAADRRLAQRVSGTPAEQLGMRTKLNGVTARTKPSSGRNSVRLTSQLISPLRLQPVGNDSLPHGLRVPRWLLGIQLLDILDAKPEEIAQLPESPSARGPFGHLCSLTSAAASISACHAFFP